MSDTIQNQLRHAGNGEIIADLEEASRWNVNG